MDTQTIEILGRNRLIEDLLLAGLEVAIPLRDRGVDLVAYVELAAATTKFAAIPIQMKAASTRAFSIDAKYQKISNLVLVYVWGLQAPEHSQIFALTYDEALTVGDKMGWTATESWRKGSYSTSAPSRRLCEHLEPFRMDPKSWREKLARVTEIAL